MENLYRFFRTQVSRCDTRLAFAFRARYRTLRWTYRDLGERACALTLILARHGVEPGDRVLLGASNSPYWVAAYFSILARGAVVVPINPRSTPEQIDRIIDSAKAKLLLTSLQPSRPTRLVATIAIESAVYELAGCDDEPGLSAPPDRLAEIVYTSGTTGAPKGVMLTHANLLADLEALAQAIPLRCDDWVLTLVPLWHMYGQMTGMLFPIRTGCTVSHVASLSSRAILEVFAFAPISHLIAVPEFLHTVMARLERRSSQVPKGLRALLRRRYRRSISKTLRMIATGGAALDPELESKWLALGYQVLQGYGLTETSPIITINTPTIGSVPSANLYKTFK